MLVIRNLWREKKNPKRILKAKKVFATYPDNSKVRVSNYIKIIVKDHFVFIFQEDYKSPNKRKNK